MPETPFPQHQAPNDLPVKLRPSQQLLLPQQRTTPQYRRAPVKYRTTKLLGRERNQRRLPTPLPTGDRSATPAPTKQRQINLSRWQLLLHLGHWIMAEAFCGLLRRDPLEQRNAHIHKLLRHFSGVWLLLGQALSMEKHFHSRDLVKDLAPLQPIDIKHIHHIINRQLGRPFDSIFSDFHPQPIAVGEFATIYLARLRREKADVIVKVQRPEVEQIFNRDKPVLSFIRRLLETFHISPHMHWAEQFQEIEQIVLQVQDYRYEAASIRRVRKLFKTYKILVPKVYEEYSGPSILVSEYLPAPSLHEVLDFQRRDPQRAADWLAENNISLYKLRRRIFDYMMRHLLEDNLFHIDLCPHNVFLLRDGRIALLDLDITSLDKQFVNILTIMLRALNNQDYDQAADMLFLMCDALPMIDLDEVKGDIVRCFRANNARSELHKIPYVEKGIIMPSAAVAQVLFRHKIQGGWQLLKVWRALSSLDMTLAALGVEESFTHQLKRYFRKSARRRLRHLFANGMIEPLMRVANTISEVVMFQTASLRRTARVYQGTIGKVEYSFSILLRLIARGVVVGGLVGVWVYLHQHHHTWVAFMDGTWTDEMTKQVRFYPKVIWGAALFGAIYLYFTLHQLARRLMQKDVKPYSQGGLRGS